MLQRRQPAKLGDALQEVEDSVKADQVLINSLPVGLSTDGKGNELRQRTLREAKNTVSFPPQLRLGRAVCQKLRATIHLFDLQGEYGRQLRRTVEA